MNKPKIKISYDAYYKFIDTLDNREEFNCIRFTLPKKGCGPKIDIFLDRADEDEISERIDELPIVYPTDIYKTYKEITIVYRDDAFKIKATGPNDHFTGLLENTKKGCSGGCNCPKKK